MIQHSFAHSFPFVIASGSSLIVFGFHYVCYHLLTPRDSLHPQACALDAVKTCIAVLVFARIWLSAHSKYISYTAPLHISFHWPISPVQHRTPYQNLLCCHVQVTPGIRHNPYTQHIRIVVYLRLWTCVAVHTLAISSRPALLLGHVCTPFPIPFFVYMLFLSSNHSFATSYLLSARLWREVRGAGPAMSLYNNNKQSA